MLQLFLFDRTVQETDIVQEIVKILRAAGRLGF